mmetsp:Transcript_113211/g.283437  ORF Transcript_113211/g.283437 Transcript_113211/m.283437 type:complete len:199 (-) Transcript_113211:104-700(-)
MACRAALLAGLLFGASTGEDAFQDRILAGDDECKEGTECSLNVLQVRATGTLGNEGDQHQSGIPWDRWDDASGETKIPKIYSKSDCPASGIYSKVYNECIMKGHYTRIPDILSSSDCKDGIYSDLAKTCYMRGRYTPIPDVFSSSDCKGGVYANLPHKCYMRGHFVAESGIYSKSQCRNALGPGFVNNFNKCFRLTYP